jgi:hypothetical protein
MGAKGDDKTEQFKLLASEEGLKCEWYGVRPLQMGQWGVPQKHTGLYDLGMIPFSGKPQDCGGPWGMLFITRLYSAIEPIM